MHPGDPIDDPDFISRMRTALPRPPEPPVAGTPPTYHDMEHAVKKGSPATSFDDLPRPLVSALPGFGLRVLVGVLEAPASGIPRPTAQRSSTSAWPRSSRRGWCATAGPSCWSLTSGGWRWASCRMAKPVMTGIVTHGKTKTETCPTRQTTRTSSKECRKQKHKEPE